MESDDESEVDEPLNQAPSVAAPSQGEAAASSDAASPSKAAAPNVNDGHTGLSDDSDEEFKEESKMELDELGLGSDSDGEEGKRETRRITRVRALISLDVYIGQSACQAHTHSWPLRTGILQCGAGSVSYSSDKSSWACLDS